MNLRNNIPGLRHPTQQEHSAVLAQWRTGASYSYLRLKKYTALVLTIMFCSMLGTSVVGGSPASPAGFVVGILLFGTFYYIAAQQIKEYKTRLSVFEKGEFWVTNADGFGCWTHRGIRHYISYTSAKLENGDQINDLPIPYGSAKKVRRIKGDFPILLVYIEGESKPLAFLR